LFGFIASHASLGASFVSGGILCALLTMIAHPLINRKSETPTLSARPAVAE
jgi:hypothetical protein